MRLCVLRCSCPKNVFSKKCQSHHRHVTASSAKRWKELRYAKEKCNNENIFSRMIQSYDETMRVWEEENHKDCKLITCQRNNLKDTAMKKTDIYWYGSWSGREESKSHECHDWNDDRDTHIIIRFYLNFIETRCLLVSLPSNKTNEKDNWVWKIKSYRYDFVNWYRISFSKCIFYVRYILSLLFFSSDGS